MLHVHDSAACELFPRVAAASGPSLRVMCSMFLRTRGVCRHADQASGLSGTRAGTVRRRAHVAGTWSSWLADGGVRRSSLRGHAKSAKDADGARELAEVDSRRSEEHTSELQSPVPISYAVFCLKKKNKIK